MIHNAARWLRARKPRWWVKKGSGGETQEIGVGPLCHRLAGSLILFWGGGAGMGGFGVQGRLGVSVSNSLVVLEGHGV